MNNVARMLEEDFSEKININTGDSRRRDHILRIIPSYNSQSLFKNAFHKLISNEMARINSSIDT